MQVIESQTLILYHADLRGEWPQEAAGSLAARLPYGKRLEVGAHAARAPATLAGVALALRALQRLAGTQVGAADLVFPDGGKPHLAPAVTDSAPVPDFSISHSGPWVGCAAVARGLVGFDLEQGTEPRLAEWAAREAALKACGAGIAAAREVELLTGGARCRGVDLIAMTLGLFPGAVACVMTSLPVGAVDSQQLPLAELFAS